MNAQSNTSSNCIILPLLRVLYMYCCTIIQSNCHCPYYVVCSLDFDRFAVVVSYTLLAVAVGVCISGSYMQVANGFLEVHLNLVSTGLTEWWGIII